MMNEREKAIEKVRKMMAMTKSNGASEAEATLAMEKVGKLLEQFDIDISEVWLSEVPIVEKKVGLRFKNKPQIVSCVVALAEFTDTQCWSTKIVNEENEIEYAIVFFGYETDVMLAEYLLNLVFETCQSEALKYAKTEAYKNARSTRSANSNFKKGFSHRMSIRFQELKKDRDAEKKRAEEAMAEDATMVATSEEAMAAAAKATTGTDLVEVKKNKVEEALAEKGMFFCYVRNHDRSNYDHNARSAGISAANTVNINRPVNSGSSNVAGYISS